MQPTRTTGSDAPVWKTMLLLLGGAVLLGVIGGLVLYAVTWGLQDTIRDPEAWRWQRFRRHGGPIIALPFVAIGAVLSLATMRAGRRLGGHRVVAALAAAVAVVTAVGLALGLASATLEPWSGRFWHALRIAGLLGLITIPLTFLKRK